MRFVRLELESCSRKGIWRPRTLTAKVEPEESGIGLQRSIHFRNQILYNPIGSEAMKRPLALLLVGLVIVGCSQSTAGGAAPARPGPAPPPEPVLDPVGEYDYQTEAMGAPISGTMTITGSPGAYTGSMTSDMGAISLRDIKVEGNELSAVGDSPDFVVFFVLVFEGDTFTGEWDAEGMTGFITGSKR